MDLTPLMKPKSVAVVGASQRVNRATRVIVNLQRFGYAGRVFPINAKYTEILGLPCYPDLASIRDAACGNARRPALASGSFVLRACLVWIFWRVCDDLVL